MPAPLREIGFDQNLDGRCRSTPSSRTRPADRAAGRLLRIEARRARVCVLRLPDALHAGAERADEHACRALARRRQGLRGRARQLRSARKAGAGCPEEGRVSSRYRRPGTENGWHFLTGAEPAIERVANAAGFRYAWDEETRQFAHPTGIIVVTPDGRPARYLFGIEYGPRDVRLALVEASEGKVGSVADALLLYCYHYDPMTGRYGLYVMRAIRVAGAATVLLIATFIVVMIRREKYSPLKPQAWSPKPRTDS